MAARALAGSRTVWWTLGVVLLLALVPTVFGQYRVGLATEILIFALLAMAIDILAGFAGRTSLGHGAIFGVSTYVVLYFVNVAGGAPAVGLLLGVVAATLLAVVFGLLAIRTSGVYFLLLTLALGMIVWGICLRWTSVTGGENGIRGNIRPEWLRNHVAFYYVVLAVTGVLSYAMWRFVRSPFGESLQGIRESQSRMRSLGYNVPLHLLIGFVMSGVFAGVAGGLYALYNSFVSPTTVSLAQSVSGLLMVIVGGVGTLFGALIGSAVITLLQNTVSQYTERWQMVLGALFIGTMILAPDGIVGKIRSLLRKRQ